MLHRLWEFIRNDSNRAILSWLGGGAVFVVAGAWTLFIFLHDDKRPTPSSTTVIAPSAPGITSGHDTVITGPVNIGANEKQLEIELLQGDVNQKNVANLGGLACRSYDRIVHLQISVEWPADARDEEKTDYKRLVFWNDTAEYLFPNGSYFWLHGKYEINGYFIPRRGGQHQGGVISIAFDKIDDAQVLLNPAVLEKKAEGGSPC
jgi:hypothetical protein